MNVAGADNQPSLGPNSDYQRMFLLLISSVTVANFQKNLFIFLFYIDSIINFLSGTKGKLVVFRSPNA